IRGGTFCNTKSAPLVESPIPRQRKKVKARKKERRFAAIPPMQSQCYPILSRCHKRKPPLKTDEPRSPIAATETYDSRPERDYKRAYIDLAAAARYLRLPV